MDKRTLLVFDGHNIFIRGYSGLMKQELRNSDGVGTWGVYGTINTISSMIRRFEPSHVLIAFDQGRSSKRLAIDPQYKANRNRKKEETEEPVVDEFRPQLELVFEIVKSMGIPYLRLQDVEADDIIAKAATAFGPVFDKVVIVSADHDIRQLIRENVIVVKPSLGQSKDIKEEIFDVESVINEWGIDPWRLPEIWALMGDKGDNIPGVPGIGPKKATKLIQDYGTLDNIFNEGNDKISPHEEVVRRAFSLIELKGLDDIPFPPLGNLQFKPVGPDTPHHGEHLLKLFDYFELNSIKDRWLKGTLWTESTFGRKLFDE